MGFFSKENREKRIVNRYVRAGREIGEAIDFMTRFGKSCKCAHFHKLLVRWNKTEKAYADLGYRTISVDKFTGCISGKHIDDDLRVIRGKRDKIIYHAEVYEMFWSHYKGDCDIFPTTEDPVMLRKWQESKI